jgi:hypothetical protein
MMPVGRAALFGVFPAARELQVPLLALFLLGGCASKGLQVIRNRSFDPAFGPTGLFPWRLRRPIMIAMCVVEFGLGLALVATAGRVGVGLPATATRSCAALFFLIATGTLYEARQHRPEAGCGCFGELSVTPIGLRTIARAGVFCVAAAGALGAPPLRMPSSGTHAWVWLGVLAIELALVAALSPEIGVILVRLGYTEPCELRRLPVGRTLTALRVSPLWRRYTGQLTADAPTDVWREGCWRFVVFPGFVHGRPVDVVFAVYLQGRRPPIRAAVLDQATSEVLPSARESAVL